MWPFRGSTFTNHNSTHFRGNKCKYCTVTKYQDSSYKVYYLCTNHVKKVVSEGWFWDSTYYYTLDDVELTLIKSDINIKCGACSRIRQWKCQNYPPHLLWMCDTHYERYNYRCPEDNTSLVQA